MITSESSLYSLELRNLNHTDKVLNKEEILRQESSTFIQEAINYYASGQYNQAIALWNKALKLSENKKETASIHTSLGAAYLHIGQVNQAIQHWEQAEAIYQTSADEESRRLLSKILVDRAQAYNALGQFRQAIPLLEEAIAITANSKEQKTEAVAHGALGNAYAISGDYDKALDAYQASLKLATTFNNREHIVTALNNQVNVLSLRSKGYSTQILTAQWEGDFQEQDRLSQLAERDRVGAFATAARAVQEKSEGASGVRASINMIELLQQSPSQESAIAEYQQQAIGILKQMPDSHSKASLLINLSDHLPLESKVKNLNWAVSVTKTINDSRSQSYALGALGNVYEVEGQLSEAMNLTRQAQLAAQQVNATESLYRWQWQAGRIYKAQGATQQARAAYRQAITTLQSIRGDIVAANRDLQFDVRDRVEPVYRELMSLLLDDNEEGNIKEAQQVADLLKLTELQSFFGDECLEVEEAISSPQNAPVKPNEAVISSIILEQKSFMTLRLPDGSAKSYPVMLTSQQLQSKIKQFRQLLEDIVTDRYLAEAQELYNLLIGPMSADLEKVKPRTLVFINDGVLRNVPMAALHDGKQFLVEKYPISTTLGFSPTASDKPSQNEALIFGLTVRISPFAALPNVNAETEAIEDITGGERFLDKEFTLSNLEKKVQQENYPIVHIATHGQFGGTSENTFLQAFDKRIFLKEFEEMLRSSKVPIELLTLSACQTAAGDDRSTLGLAGLAVRTGVKSVLASLWFVNDAEIVPLIEDFYHQLRQPDLTKAEALRIAQIKLIADPNGHPAIWSSFILITR